MSKSYITKSALLLSLLAAASATGMAYAEENPSTPATPAVNSTQEATAAPSQATPSQTTPLTEQTSVATATVKTPAPTTPTEVTTAEEPTTPVATPANAETKTDNSAPAETSDQPLTARSVTEAETKEVVPVEGTTVDMRILSTTDLHTNLVNYDYYQDKTSQSVGLAKTAVLIKKAKEENGNTILVDSGDTIQGTPFGTYEALINPVKEGETHPMYKAFEKLGYDAETLGNHEFNYGLDFLNRMVNAANLNIINANIRDAKTGQNYYTPYKIIEKHFTDTKGNPVTIKVGITGVVPTQILVWDKANLEGKVIVDDPLEAVKAMVPKMKADGADFILVAAHSGIGDDQYTKNEENEGYQLAGIDGVDAVATGHSHANFPNGDGTSFYAKYTGVDDVNGLINGKPVVMAGKFGDHLGIMDVQLTYKDGKWTVTNSKAKLQKIDTKPDGADQELIDMVSAEHQGTIDYVRKEVGETTAPITSYFAQVIDDPSIQIVNNAQTWYVKQQLAGTADADLPVLSAAAPFKAGTRGDATYYTDIPVGPLAIKNVADLYLYDNVTAIIKLTGSQIKEWLEMSAGQFNQIDPNSKEPQQLINSNYRSYNFDVIDGLTYQYDITQPNKYDFEGKLVNPNASRVRNLKYQGKEINPNQIFIVASNNYRATGNFPGVRDAAEKRLLNLENRQAIIDYIVSEKVINPSADKNWSFTNSIKGLDIRFLSSETAQKYLADHKDITYIGPSSSEGFGEYQFHYLDPEVVPAVNPENPPKTGQTSQKQEEPVFNAGDKAYTETKTTAAKPETPKQKEFIYNMVAKTYAGTKATSAKPETPKQEESVYNMLAKAYAETKATSAKSETIASLSKQTAINLPATGSSDNKAFALLGLIFLTLAGLFGKKTKRN